MSVNKRRLEARLDGRQRKAALLLVQREFLPNSERRTLTDIGEEVGVSDRTLYTWKTQNRDFIDYMNELSDDFLSAERSFVYGQLLKSIKGGQNGQPSVKAIDLFLRRHGLITNVVENRTDESGGGAASKDIEKDIADLDALLEGDEGGESAGDDS